jgi:hypothetical protein
VKVEIASRIPFYPGMRFLPRQMEAFLEDDWPFASYDTTRKGVPLTWVCCVWDNKGNTKHRRSRKFRRLRRAWHERRAARGPEERARTSSC